MKKWIRPLVLLMVLGGFLAWWYSPSEVVKRRTDRLFGVMGFEKGEGRVTRQAGAYALQSLLAKEVELSSEDHPEANGMFVREQLESAHSWMAGRVVSSSFERVEFEGVRVNKGMFAEVDVLVDAEVQLPDSKPVDGRYQVFMVWEKDDSGWRMAHAKWTRAGGRE